MAGFSLKSWLAEGGTISFRSAWRESYARIGWVNSNIGVLADTISGVPLNLYDEKDNLLVYKDKKARKHPLFKLFNPPKQYIYNSVAELIAGTIVLRSIYGEAFWHVEKTDNSKKPSEIDIFPPQRLKPSISDANDPYSKLSGWVLFDSQNRKVKTYGLRSNEVVQFKLYNPYSPYTGLSQLEPARMAVEQAFNQENPQDSSYRKRHLTSAVLQIKEKSQDNPFS